MTDMANNDDIKTIWPKHTRLASHDISTHEKISTIALTMGLRSNLPALRMSLEKRLITAFEHETRSSTERDGMSF